MTNLTLTINLDSLTATQLAALRVVVLAGVNSIGEQKTAHTTVSKAGEANWGNGYYRAILRLDNFLKSQEA